MLRRLFELMMRDQDRLAELITLEVGKPVAEARGEIAYAAGFIEWSAEEAKRIYGEMVPAFVPDKRILVLRQPIGVSGCHHALEPAVGHDHAQARPGAGRRLHDGREARQQDAAERTGPRRAMPRGGHPAGRRQRRARKRPGSSRETLLADARVRALSFTGSTEVGKRLMVLAAEHVTQARPGARWSRTGARVRRCRPGPCCGRGPRLQVPQRRSDVHLRESRLRAVGIHDRFVEALTVASEALSVGDGFAPGTHIGPLVDDRAVAKVEEHIAGAVAGGATVVTGGKRLPPPDGHADRFFAPTVITGVQPGMAIMTEETFGPVAPVVRFEDEADAVAMANDTPYGLAAYLYTRDASRLMRVAEALEYGIVGANDGLPSTPQAPFGGVKESGLGREGGKWGLDEYLETKFISWQLDPGMSASRGDRRPRLVAVRHTGCQMSRQPSRAGQRRQLETALGTQRQVAAIDREVGAGHEARVIAEQEGDGRSHLAGLGTPVRCAAYLPHTASHLGRSPSENRSRTSVQIQPGLTLLDRILCGARSSAWQRVSSRMPPLLAL